LQHDRAAGLASASSVSDDAPVIQVTDLRIGLESGPLLVRGVSFDVRRGEVLGLVGESGSGKTTTAMGLLGYAEPGVQIVDGEVRVDGQLMTQRPESEVRKLRGRVIAYVPQDPASALNPSMRVRALIGTMLRTHEGQPLGD